MKIESIIGLVGLVVLFTMLVGFIFLFIIQFKKRKYLFEIEKETTNQLFQQTLLQTQIEIQEQTLTNISKELHDNIGQTLSLAKLTLNTISKTDAEKAVEGITNAKELISQSLTDIRDLSKSMLGEKIAEIGLLTAIKNELGIMQHSGKYAIDFSANDPNQILKPQLELIAFRIIQETLHNIEKHAKANKIRVTIKYNPLEILISVCDNGIGFYSDNLDATTSGVGIINMQQRAKLINAIFKIDSKIKEGTTVSLNIYA